MKFTSNTMSRLILCFTLLLLFCCKQKMRDASQENIIKEQITSVIINNNGDTIGKLMYVDSNNLYFSPSLDTSKRIFLSKNGVSKIGDYYYNLPHNNILVFDEYSVPSKIEWYNLGKLYSEINHIKSDIGIVSPTSKLNIDTSLISLPQTFITKSIKESGKYKLSVYSNSYPIYLMFFQYNIYGDTEIEYNFIENSFTLAFNKVQMDSDTLKIAFNYLEDFVNPKDRIIIKTLHHYIVIDDE